MTEADAVAEQLSQIVQEAVDQAMTARRLWILVVERCEEIAGCELSELDDRRIEKYANLALRYAEENGLISHEEAEKAYFRDYAQQGISKALRFRQEKRSRRRR